MKKLYTLLAAALALFSLGSPTAMAQVTDITPGYYVIGGLRGSAEYNKFVCDTYGFAYAKQLSAAPTEATAETAAYIWEVATASEANGTQYYTLKNMLTGRYLKTSDFLTTTDVVVTTYSLPHAPDADALFNIVSSNGSYAHLGSRAEQYCLMQYGGASTTENKYAFHAVTVPDHFDVYCAYLNLFGADGLTEGEYTIGTDPGCVSQEVYTQLQNAASAYTSLSSESTEEEYTSALTQLREAAAALKAARTLSPGYYVILGHRARGGATSGLLYDNNGTVSSQRMDVPSTITTADNAINVWKLTASTSDGGLQYFTLQNVSTGNYMQRPGNFQTSSAASTANSGRIAFPAATGRLFLLQDGGGYIGHVDGSGNLVHWQDANSTYNQFEIHAVDVAASVFCDIAYTNLFGTSGFAESNYVVGTDPGCISQEVLNQLKEASDAYVALNKSSSDEDYNRVTELLNAAATALATGRVQLTPGYYIIRGTRSTSGSYVDALYDNSGTLCATENTSLTNPMTDGLSQYIWKAEEVTVDGTTYYTMRNLSTGKYMKGAGSGGAFTTTDAATSKTEYFKFPHYEGQQFLLQDADGHQGNLTHGQKVVQYKFSSDPSNRFTFEAVPVIEVREVGYATLYVNFAYEMPEGLTGSAITGVEQSGDVKVATCAWEYSAGKMVPALEAILIKGNQGTYYGTKTTGGTGVEGNLLRGTLTTQTPAAEDGYVYYKLSRNAETNELGFWWGADGGGIFENQANRAYLALPQATAASITGLVLEPGSDITGITSPTLSTSEQPAAIYTLGGVRVNSSTTDGLPAGIYIVGGKKVLVK